MICEKCKQDKIQVVSEYVELEEKDNATITIVLGLVAIASALLGVILLLVTIFSTLSANKVIDVIFSLPGFGFGVGFLSFGIVCGLLKGLIQALTPFKHVTRLRAICLECGNTWIIESSDKKE